MQNIFSDSQESNPCPVCQMTEVKQNLWRSYRGLQFWFCSQQCLDRFIAHPGLYVGSPKTGLPEKKRGKVEHKSHRIVFSKSLSDNEVEKLIADLSKMMGIKSLSVSTTELLVMYDLMEVSLEDIENQISLSLGGFDSPMIDRVKRSWIHYTEECELENLAHPSTTRGCH